MTPAIVLVPGSFTLPSFYTELLQPLSAKGYDIRAVPLRSAIAKGPESPTPLATMSDDAVAIAGVVEGLADEGRDVVIVSHSYGGTPATESIRGLSKQAREKDGKKGGVVRLAYMAALVPEEGQSAGDVSAGGGNDGGETLEPVPDENGWLSVPDIDGLIRFSFSDVQPAELAREWADRIARHSAAAFMGALTYPGYKDVPVSWLFTTGDALVLPATQQGGIDVVEKASGNKVDVTKIEAGHIPYIMKLDETVAWIEKVAGRSS